MLRCVVKVLENNEKVFTFPEESLNELESSIESFQIEKLHTCESFFVGTWQREYFLARI